MKLYKQQFSKTVFPLMAMKLCPNPWTYRDDGIKTSIYFQVVG